MNKGLTMLELMVAVAIVGFALVGLLISYISSLNLNEFDRNLTIGMNIAREKMEELYNLRNIEFDYLGQSMCANLAYTTGCSSVPSGARRIVSFNNDNISHNYNGFNGSCTIYITDKAAGSIPTGWIKEARVIVSWRQRLGNIIGEDRNLNGALDSGEDVGGHSGELDSPCELISAFVKR